MFLTFIGRNIYVWNFKGENVTQFEDHELYTPDCNTNNICISKRQDMIISVCRRKLRNASDHDSNTNQNTNNKTGTINISNILTGKCLTKITVDNASSNEKETKTMCFDALQDITSLHYDENINELYTGSKSGKLYVWSV